MVHSGICTVLSIPMFFLSFVFIIFIVINALQQNTQLMSNRKTDKLSKINKFKQFHFECQFGNHETLQPASVCMR